MTAIIDLLPDATALPPWCEALLDSGIQELSTNDYEALDQEFDRAVQTLFDRYPIVRTVFECFTDEDYAALKHSIDTARIAYGLATIVDNQAIKQYRLSRDEFVQTMLAASLLHDVGKTDPRVRAVTLSPKHFADMTEEQRDIIKHHGQIGWDIAANIDHSGEVHDGAVLAAEFGFDDDASMTLPVLFSDRPDLDKIVYYIMRRHQRDEGGEAHDENVYHQTCGLFSYADSVHAVAGDNGRNYNTAVSRHSDTIIDTTNPAEVAKELSNTTSRTEGYMGVSHQDMVRIGMNIDAARRRAEERVGSDILWQRMMQFGRQIIDLTDSHV